MKHTNMRNALIAFGALGSLAAVLTACGGGGGSSPAVPQSVATPGVAASLPPGGISVNTSTGPQSKVTVSITIPDRIARNMSQNSSRLTAQAKTNLQSLHDKMRAKYGPRIKDAHLRTMANTSPSAVIRAAGAAQNRYAAALEKKTGRSPQFISGTTSSIEFVLSNGNTPVDDEEADCDGNTCTITASVPIGTGFTATLYLYDFCDFLIAAGSQSGVNIVAGANPPLTLTINPIVGYFDFNLDNSNFSFGTPATNNIGVTPLDFDFDDVGGPGVLLDNNFNTITSLSFTTDSADFTVSPASFTIPTLDNTFSGQFSNIAVGSYDGTGTALGYNLTVTAVTNNTPAVPNFGQAGNNGGTNTGNTTVYVSQPSLTWSGQSSGYNWNDIADQGNNTQFSAEFPAPTGQAYMFGLTESLAYSGNITLSDNGFCSGVATTTPPLNTPTAYSTLSAFPYVTVTLQGSAASNNCQIIATDSNNNNSSLLLYVDSSTVTVQGKARSHK